MNNRGNGKECPCISPLTSFYAVRGKERDKSGKGSTLPAFSSSRDDHKENINVGSPVGLFSSAEMGVK